MQRLTTWPGPAPTNNLLEQNEERTRLADAGRRFVENNGASNAIL